MTVAVTPLPKNANLNPDRTVHVDADNKKHTSPFYFLIMMPNIIGLFDTGYRRNDYSLAVFGLLIFSVFVLVDCCLPSSQKTVALGTVALICSVGLLYAFINLVSDWKIRRSEEHQILDAGKSNHAYSVLGKV
ncbi:hypothetical protein L1987_46743 [Smallanthus sonchifolius]|uniref:Uncharacterized protein n=1 Tax=Smallanthus sonchifolius TaxID=185202 RepID=A0ACB9G1P4_9ASTR|nr:hypothetical protein L1987_46743 [Smallanthus sonchifolius]